MRQQPAQVAQPAGQAAPLFGDNPDAGRKIEARRRFRQAQRAVGAVAHPQLHLGLVATQQRPQPGQQERVAARLIEDAAGPGLKRGNAGIGAVFRCHQHDRTMRRGGKAAQPAAEIDRRGIAQPADEDHRGGLAAHLLQRFGGAHRLFDLVEGRRQFDFQNDAVGRHRIDK